MISFYESPYRMLYVLTIVVYDTPLDRNAIFFQEARMGIQDGRNPV